jgi:hypothetical protein
MDRISTESRGSEIRQFQEALGHLACCGDVQAMERVLAYARAMLTSAEIEQDIRADWMLAQVFGVDTDPE